MKQKMSARYILILIAMCGLVASGVGLLTNIAGLFFTPVSEEFGIERGSVSLTLTIANIVYAIGGMIAPKIFKEKNLKVLLITGTALEAGCTFLLSTAGSIGMMYVLNAIRGFAAGLLGFVLVTTVINAWFKASVGLVTSIAMGFSGIAGAVFSTVISAIIQSSGWRSGYMSAAIMMVILNLPAILFLPSLDPKTKGLMAFGENNASSEQTHYVNTASSPANISKLLMFMAIVYAITACGATALPQHFPGIAESFSLSESIGSGMLSFSMIANTLGKIILGILIDRIGSRKSIMLYTIFAIIAVLLFLFVHAGFAMLLGAALFGVTYALGTVGAVMITKDLFGIENYGNTYPTISLFGTVSNAVFSTVIGYMYDFSGGYISTLIMLLGMLIIEGVIVISAYQNKNRQTATRS